MKLRIKELRLAAGLSQEELASRAGISRNYLSEMETGRKTINARRIDQVATALGVSPLDLLDDQALPPDIAEHIAILKRLDPESRADVLRHAKALSRKD